MSAGIIDGDNIRIGPVEEWRTESLWLAQRWREEVQARGGSIEVVPFIAGTERYWLLRVWSLGSLPRSEVSPNA